ncbi:type II secretion system F family protein [Methanosphaera sp.]
MKNVISDDKLNTMQNNLLTIGFHVKIEYLISWIIFISSIIFLLTFIFIILFDYSFLILSLSLLPSILIIIYFLYKIEQRNDKLDEDLPDFLRQLASLLKVGLGLESALNELSEHNTNTPLNNEIKRILLEIQLGKSFDDALFDCGDRNDSDNLKHVFQIIIYSKKSGGNLADILEDIAEDLSELILLKKERKANVMMSVMFLLISSVVATPFALGMIRLYSDFIEHLGRTNSLISVIPITSLGYIVIHSILVSLLLGIVMYSNIKRGIKYIIIITPASVVIYYMSQLIFKSILGLGGVS